MLKSKQFSLCKNEFIFDVLLLALNKTDDINVSFHSNENKLQDCRDKLLCKQLSLIFSPALNNFPVKQMNWSNRTLPSFSSGLDLYI